MNFYNVYNSMYISAFQVVGIHKLFDKYARGSYYINSVAC